MQWLRVRTQDGGDHDVNPAQITHIEQLAGVCTVYFSKDDALQVQESLAELHAHLAVI